MAIQAKRNKNYGGAVVTQKYSPLEELKFNKTKTVEYSAVLTNRVTQLTNANLLPQPLTLITDWTTAIAAVTGHDPPLVVISSNRSKWIAKGVEMSQKQWHITQYEGSHDLDALTGNVKDQKQSPPLYVPLRTEGDRKIFIVVHAREYADYRTALADSGMTVVGWSFRAPVPAPVELSGFGASRYAAIEFCKHLRANMAGVKWDYAWLLDDNVVGITGFPGYAAVEEAMSTASADDEEQVCSAFKGCANVESFAAIKKWATEASRAAAALPEPETPRGIIQQAALWNIKYMTEKKLNFSPLFVASGEDVSIGNYFNAVIAKKAPAPAKPAIPYLYYGGMKVRKEIVEIRDHDESAGAIAVRTAREAYSAWFATQEATRPGGTPPPPVEVESTRTETVSAFITTWFNSDDPDVKPLVAGKNATVQATAKCQAVEQIACAAIWDKTKEESYVTKAAVDQVFEIPGAAGQVIVRQPPP